MDEIALIERFFSGRGIRREEVRLGIGDDAAITSCSDEYELVIATDTICVGTHFPDGTPPHALGHRCLAVNLSDLAAMGADPMWCTLALTLPEAEPDWVRRFADGFFALADRFDVALIGGDTVRGPLAMTVTVHGRIEPGRAIRRNGARDGDLIYVTGVPGQAAAGLRSLLASGMQQAAGADLARRFLYPEPRVREGRDLVGLATAMIDVSDGLMIDTMRLLSASGLGARLDLADLPLPDAGGAEDALELALNGGDDYELCFCLPPQGRSELLRMASDWTCPVTRIGTVQRTPEVVWLIDGRPCNTAARHFEHFPEQT